ncbi:hypothetical protein [uncultured Microbacterium sp.]|uniref:hypothetical protein n=1 Tax=uncultured Microbacterium sp. TaxID=191216 RepID=UPI00268E9C1C
MNVAVASRAELPSKAAAAAALLLVAGHLVRRATLFEREFVLVDEAILDGGRLELAVRQLERSRLITFAETTGQAQLTSRGRAELEVLVGLVPAATDRALRATGTGRGR